MHAKSELMSTLFRSTLMIQSILSSTLSSIHGYHFSPRRFMRDAHCYMCAATVRRFHEKTPWKLVERQCVVAKNTTMLDAETAAHDHHYGDDDADDEDDDADDAEARMTMMTIMLMMVQMIMMMLMLMLPPMHPFCLVRVTLALMMALSVYICTT